MRIALLTPLLAATFVPLAAGVQESAKPADPPVRAVPQVLEFANALLRDRRYDLAADEYEKYLKSDPAPGDAADARYGLASARLFLGQYPQARREFEAFLQAAPDHANAPTARFRVGETAYMLGDLPAAREALDRYVTDNPKHRHLETALPYLGDVCLRLGDLPRARKAYQQSVDDFPKGRLIDRARYGLARTLAAQDDRDAALGIFTDLAEHGGPEWADKARFQIGIIQAAADHHAEAVEAYTALETAFPRSPMVPEARLRRARSLIRLGRYDEAEPILTPLAAGDGPLAPQAAYELGDSLAQRKRTDEALAAWDAAATRFPTSSTLPALLFRAAELLSPSKPADARTRLLKVADDHPTHPWADDALVRAAELALRTRDFADARRLAEALPKRFPKSDLSRNARLIVAQAALGLNKPKDAVAILEALRAEPNLPPEIDRASSLALALAYRTDGQAEKAAAMLARLAESPAGAGGADAQVLLGENHVKAARFDEAVAPLNAYLNDHPKGELADHALALLAIAQQELGRGDEAKATLERLTRDFAQSRVLTAPRLRLGEAALEAKDYGRAVELLRAAADSKTDPELRTRALSALGWAYLGDKKPVEAANAFDELLTTAPDDALAPDAALARGRALEEAGKTDDALTAYALVGARYEKSDRVAPASLARARLLARTGKHAEAAAAFDALLKDNPKGLPDSGADVLLAEMGWALLDSEKPAEADAAFIRLLQDYPESPRAADARVNLAESAYQAGKLDEVSALLEPVISTPAADPALVQSALFRLGRARFDRKDFAGALKTFDRLVTEYPDGPLRPKARFWKAETAFQADDPKAADTEFAALLIEPKPGDADDWWPTARLRHIQCLVQLEEWDEALKAADSMKAEVPNFPRMDEVDYARGRAFQGIARFDEARTAYQAVIDSHKGAELAARAQFMRGETYFHQRNYVESLKEFFKVEIYYEVPKWEAAALLEAGKVYEQMSRPDKAVETYEKLKKAYPTDPNIAEADKRLAALKGAPAEPPAIEDAPR